MRLKLFVFLSLLCSATMVHADEKLKGIACRSVHLGYPSKEVSAFTTTVVVKQSAPGTYFMVCGWDKGYFGIQEQGNGKKLAIFSVWDSPQNDKNKVKDELRVKVLHQGEGVRVGRFGGEGTGGQSFYDMDWKVDQPYRFLVTAKKIDDQRTAYAGYLKQPDAKEWLHMITFSTITGGRVGMKGLYSFVEDFKRDRISTTLTRRAEFGQGWVKPLGQDSWEAITQARFTGDGNPVVNIDAGSVAGVDRFFLATGGEIQMTGPKLRDMIALPEVPRTAPTDFPKLP